jgi:hypothetical protein
MGEQFDGLARAVGAATSRRQMLRTTGIGAGGALIALLLPGRAGAARRECPPGTSQPCSAGGMTICCPKGSTCCTATGTPSCCPTGEVVNTGCPTSIAGIAQLNCVSVG